MAKKLPKPSTQPVNRWPVIFAGGVLICLVSLALQVAIGEIAPGNVWSIAYGIACAAVMVAVALFGVRRRLPALASRLRFGGARAWLRFHIYGGTLFLLLLFMHCGFSLPDGALNWWMWYLSLWTVLSGAVGLLLQRWLPRVMSSGLSSEALYERIPELIDDLRQRAETINANCTAAVQALYAREMAPALAGPHRQMIYFVDVTGGIQSRLRAFIYLRDFLSGEERERLGELETIYRTKLELDAHYSLQWPLRWWLLLHVPFSIVLLLLVLIHTLTVVYY